MNRVLPKCEITAEFSFLFERQCISIRIYKIFLYTYSKFAGFINGMFIHAFILSPVSFALTEINSASN